MTREQRQAKARRMYRRGRGRRLRDIADELGVSVGTAHRDVNPEADERYRVAARERKRHRRKQEVSAT